MKHHNFSDAEINVQGSKTLFGNVNLQIELKSETEESSDSFIDGLRTCGEWIYDVPPPKWTEKRHIRPGVSGTLTLRSFGKYCKLNVLFVEKLREVGILKDRIRREFWSFFAIGRPLHDDLNLFPFVGTDMRVFSITDFHGRWPSGLAAIIVASDSEHARRLIRNKLQEEGIEIEIDYNLVEISLSSPSVNVLSLGNLEDERS